MNGDWRRESPPSRLIGDRLLSFEAQERAFKKTKDDLMNYLLNEAAVEWQLSKVNS